MMSSETSTRRNRKQRRAASAANGAAHKDTRPVAAPVDEEPEQESQASEGLQPWHLFVLGSLVAASAAALLLHGTRPANVIFVSLAILIAGGVGLALYATLWPLFAKAPAPGPEMLGGRTRAALEREKMLVLRTIKELEFDRAMGKVSEADCQEMIARLRARAVRLIRQLDAGAAGYRELIEKELAARKATANRAATSTSPGGAVVPAPMAARVPVANGGGAKAAPDLDVAAVACARCGTPNDPDAEFCKKCGTKLAVAV